MSTERMLEPCCVINLESCSFRRQSFKWYVSFWCIAENFHIISWALKMKNDSTGLWQAVIQNIGDLIFFMCPFIITSPPKREVLVDCSAESITGINLINHKIVLSFFTAEDFVKLSLFDIFVYLFQ